MRLRLIQYSYDVINSEVDILHNCCDGTVVLYDIKNWPSKLSLIHKLDVYLTGERLSICYVFIPDFR